MDKQLTESFINQTWDNSIIPQLVDYIRIPNKSPAYDKDWQQHGYMEQAVTLFTTWIKQQAIKNLKLEVKRLPNRTPLIFMEIPGDLNETILLYGHLDKQPEMSGWSDGLGPWQPVIRDNKLYGRGGADDGYACFASLTAIAALQQQNIPHARCVIIIEACEESGSYDLPFYLAELAPQIGTPNFVICLDSGCQNYDQLWNTTSLRGIVDGLLRIEVSKNGMHSGSASGAIPSSFRILRMLLERIENSQTGEVLLASCQATIPLQRREQAQATANLLGNTLFDMWPVLPGVSLLAQDKTEILLNTTWRSSLCITSMDGFPPIASAGSVLRPYTAAKLSLRIPPTCDPNSVAQELKNVLEKDPPYQAQISFTLGHAATGWNAPAIQDWLKQASDNASQNYFAKPMAFHGEGGTIPFMAMLGEKFPQAQFLITGVLGPKSNAHGPNEFLHIPMVKKITACIAHVIHEHYLHFSGKSSFT